MSKVDWSLAPSDATHARDYQLGVDFYKRENSRWVYYDSGSWKVALGTSERDCVDRPVKREWSGPEDGLPPVGLKCMHDEEVVEILAHRAFKGHEHDTLLVVFATADDVSFSSPCFFRPIVRADQIAAEKRETAIRELMDIAQVDCRVTAARLVDAGFTREVV